ncbi:hypothetical protein WJX77_010305 [Trebouxia sp. C0004]
MSKDGLQAKQSVTPAESSSALRRSSSCSAMQASSNEHHGEVLSLQRSAQSSQPKEKAQQGEEASRLPHHQPNAQASKEGHNQSSQDKEAAGRKGARKKAEINESERCDSELGNVDDLEDSQARRKTEMGCVKDTSAEARGLSRGPCALPQVPIASGHSAEQTSGTQAAQQVEPKQAASQEQASTGDKVKQGLQNAKDKLTGHTMAASGPIAPSTGSVGSTGTSTGHVGCVLSKNPPSRNSRENSQLLQVSPKILVTT